MRNLETIPNIADESNTSDITPQYIIVDIRNGEIYRNSETQQPVVINSYEDALKLCGMCEWRNVWICKIVHNHIERKCTDAPFLSALDSEQNNSEQLPCCGHEAQIVGNMGLSKDGFIGVLDTAHVNIAPVTPAKQVYRKGRQLNIPFPE
jgi:hypothetical protein